ncbi:hypothetical protein [Pinirhizobacter soli]|uniref:hypothetical protein n=1 Tax=Pinirhizobacter soli TaxID=2786953 RepID=UPI00202A5B23|nr:hypothetical protein [Pinirhizobacter soli]
MSAIRHLLAVVLVLLAGHDITALAADIAAAPTPKPTKLQTDELHQALEQAPVPENLKGSWQEAQPVIEPVVSFLACYAGWDAWTHLAKFQVPGFSVSTYYLSAISATRYHDPDKCMSIRHIHSVKQRADGTLTFRVLFYDADSNEEADRTFGMLRQANSSWLFARGGF